MSDSLFPDEPLTLVDDAGGGIRYWPNLADAEPAARWFQELQTRVPWASERRPMYDRIVDVPRLLAGYRMDAIPDELQALQQIAMRVARFVAAPFNSVGLNFYRDGNDSVAMHNDSCTRWRAANPSPSSR